jgi:hypothetical protein
MTERKTPESGLRSLATAVLLALAMAAVFVVAQCGGEI